MKSVAIKKGIDVIYRINNKWYTGKVIENSNKIYKVDNCNKIINKLYPIYKKGDKIIYKKKVDNRIKYYKAIIQNVNITPEGLDYQIMYNDKIIDTIPSRIFIRNINLYYDNCK